MYEASYVVKCDRCARIVNQLEAHQGVDADRKPVVAVMKNSEIVAAFFDLCERCTGRVDTLISQLGLTQQQQLPLNGSEAPEESPDA